MTDLRVCCGPGVRVRPSVRFPATQTLESSSSELGRVTHLRDGVGLVTLQERKRHAGILIRQGHHRFVEASPFYKVADPATDGISFLAPMRDHGPGPVNQDASQIPIPAFADASQLNLPAGARMLRH